MGVVPNCIDLEIDRSHYRSKFQLSWSHKSQLRSFPSFQLLLALALRILYNIYFHPLSSFKGPAYLTASDIPLAFFQLRGTSHHVLAKAHQEYGSVVRIGPNTLSFIESSAWNDIYGHRKGRAVLPKDPQFYNEMLLDKKTLTLASNDDAVPLRRAMLSAFSPIALLELEPTFQGHANHLMAQLAKTSLEKGIVDMRMWFISSLFDITSDFAFGEDLGCVRNGRFHEWVKNVVSVFYAVTLLHQCHKFWPLNRILAALIPPSVQAMKENHDQAALQRIRRRINNPTDRHDFVSHFLRNAEKENISMPVIEAQSTVVILAGSQTTATALIAAVYYILSDQNIYKKLCDEIRSAFADSTEITLQNVAAKLPYLGAVIKETLRLHTPIANGLPRLVPDGGAMISGNWIPSNVGTSTDSSQA